MREALPSLVELYADPDGAQRHAELLAAAPCPVTPVSREVLAELAVHDAPAFAALVEVARAALPTDGTGGPAAQRAA